MHEQLPQPESGLSPGAQLAARIQAEAAIYTNAAERRGDAPLSPDSPNPHDQHGTNWANPNTPLRAHVADIVGPHDEEEIAFPRLEKPGYDPLQSSAQVPKGWGNEHAFEELRQSRQSKYGRVLDERERDGAPRIFVIDGENGRRREAPVSPLLTEAAKPHPWRPVRPPEQARNRVTSRMCQVGKIPAGAQSFVRAGALPSAREAIPLPPAFADQTTIEVPLPPNPDMTDTAEIPLITMSVAGGATPDTTSTQPIPRVSAQAMRAGWQTTRQQPTPYPQHSWGNNNTPTHDTPVWGIPRFEPTAYGEATVEMPYDTIDPQTTLETPIVETPYDQLEQSFDPPESLLPSVNEGDDAAYTYVPRGGRGHRGERRRHSAKMPLLVGSLVALATVGGAAYVGIHNAGEATRNEAVPEHTYTPTAPANIDPSIEPTETPIIKKAVPGPSAIPSLPSFHIPRVKPTKPKASPSVKVTPSPTPTTESPRPTEKPSPTPTPRPSQTSETPSPSATPEPTAEPSPTASATEPTTPEPTSSVTETLMQPVAAILRADALLSTEPVKKPTRWERVRKASSSLFSRVVSRV